MDGSDTLRAHEQISLAYRDFNAAIEIARTGQERVLTDDEREQALNHANCAGARLQGALDLARGVGAILIAICLANYAEACHRCGRSVCLYSKPVVAAPVVAAAAPTVVNTYVVNSASYSAPLTAQGTSALVSNGGYQSQVLPLYDPNIVTSNAMQLLKATSDSLPLALTRMEQHAERIVALQAPAVEKLAAGQAAAQALTAANVTVQSPTANLSTGLVIRADSAGQLKIEALTAPQVATITTTASSVTQSVTSSTTPGESPLAQMQSGKYPLLAQFCGKCHGTDNAQPKGGLYLDDDSNVAKAMRDNWFAITDAVSSGSMPPATAPQPSKEERAELLNEMQAIIKAAPASQ